MNNHPIKVRPNPPFYRFAATALSASMWFFVSADVASSAPLAVKDLVADCGTAQLVNVPSEEGRTGIAGLETSVGSLDASCRFSYFAMYGFTVALEAFRRSIDYRMALSRRCYEV
jgi:hypothetical protein